MPGGPFVQGHRNSSFLPNGDKSPRRGPAEQAGLSKGFLNRRFKWLFAFFLSTQKEGAESGAAQVPGLRIETVCLAPAGREDERSDQVLLRPPQTA